MKAKKLIKKILPDSLYSKIKSLRNSERVETLKLNAVSKIKLDASNLRSASSVNSDDIFSKKAIWKAWESYENKIEALQIPDLTGGVNLGDRKALFFIISHFKPKSVLEVGTHIGASTVHVASALDNNFKKHDVKAAFSTLDLRDVNCDAEKPWLKFKSPKSPQELLNELDLGITTKFMSQNSLDYFQTPQDKYDFIFLDGDHSAQTVYKEVPKALKCLNPNGIILLHDYFKLGDSANPNNNFNSGPYLAMQRHVKEGADIKVMPLGELPWQTKYGSNVTSLALLLQK